MLFHKFSSQAERRAFGGSDFFELQFCRMPPDTEAALLTAVDSVHHWRDDSLYISGDDDGAFMGAYGELFPWGMYNNLETGPIDPYGINYYRAELIDPFIAKLREVKPVEYEILAGWLTTAKGYNGFYLLGV